MSPSKSEIAKKIAAFTLKMLSTALLWIGTALLTKLQFAPNAQDWKSTLDQLPIWALITLMVLLPVVWLAVEFVATCFLELRARVLGQAAPRFAEWLTEIPSAVSEVLARCGDTFLTCVSRWRFDGRYRMRIAEECKQLHAQTGLLHATASFSLEEVYTELNMASSTYGDINHGLLAKTIRGRESVYEFLRVQEPGTALVLLGRPGGGKTTLVRHLGLLFARNRQANHRLRRRIPIMIELRRVTELFSPKSGSDWKPPTLTQVIQHYWKSHASMKELMAKAPRDWLKRHLATGRVLVMVDGLDEVPHRIEASKGHEISPRQRVSRWLETEMQGEGQRGCLFLVTSRPGGFAEAPLKQRVSIVEVQSMTMAQSERFIHAFYLGCKRKEQPSAKKRVVQREAFQATEKLQKELRSKPHLADLRVNPLLLHMVCLLHNSRGRLPTHRSDLYKETCDVLLNRDLRAPGFEERLRPEDKLAALRPLAEHFMRSGSPEAKSTDELLPIVEPVFKTLDFPAREFFDFAAKDSGLLQEVEKGYWDFAHKTFYEYLTAEQWERLPPSKDELLKWVEQDWWRVTLFFYSAKSHDSPVIAAGLQSQHPSALSLAFECIHAKHRINAGERSRAQELLNDALSNPGDEQIFSTAARAVLDLKMREVQACDPEGKLLRRESRVTQAEYQLFLLSHGSNSIWDFIPPHCSSRHLTGDPLSPVQGVTFKQATAFVLWANGNGTHEWKLPVRDIDDAEFSSGWWFDLEGGIQRPRFYDLGKLPRISDPRGILQKSLANWLARAGITEVGELNLPNLMSDKAFWEGPLRRTRFHVSLRFFFSRFVKKMGAPATRFGGAIAFVIECCRTEAYGYESESEYLQKLDERRAYMWHVMQSERHSRNSHYGPLGTAFVRAYDGVPELALPNEAYGMIQDHIMIDKWWNLEHRFEPAKTIYSVLMQSLSKAGLITESDDYQSVALIGLKVAENISVGQRQCVQNRIDLICASARIIVAARDGFSQRQAYVDFALCLIEAMQPHFSELNRWYIHPTFVALKLLKARMTGQLAPWESILLVRAG